MLTRRPIISPDLIKKDAEVRMNFEPSDTPDTLAPTCARSQAILDLSWTHFYTLSRWLDGMSKATKRALGDSAENEMPIT